MIVLTWIDQHGFKIDAISIISGKDLLPKITTSLSLYIFGTRVNVHHKWEELEMVYKN